MLNHAGSSPSGKITSIVLAEQVLKGEILWSGFCAFLRAFHLDKSPYFNKQLRQN